MSEERLPDIYCDEILSGRSSIDKVHETDRVLAFHHTRPFYPTHIVVIPKAHVSSLLEIDDDLLLEMLGVVRRAAREVLRENGACRVITNLGAYQHNKHLHWHVVAGEPRE